MTGKAANSPIRRSGRYALPTKSRTHLPAALYLNLNQCAAASAGMEHNGVQIGHPLLLFPLPLPRPTPGGVSKGEGPCPRPSSPVPLGGVSKGEGPQSRPFVPRGGMGDGWRPPCFWWGSKGEESLHQRFLPLALTWECPPAGARKMWGAFPTAKPCFLSRKPGLPFAL